MPAHVGWADTARILFGVKAGSGHGRIDWRAGDVDDLGGGDGVGVIRAAGTTNFTGAESDRSVSNHSVGL